MKLTDYIQGKRRGKEANALEREAMNDPFLQDAIDGFDSIPDNHLETIHELENRIVQKANNRKRNYAWWSIGAAAVLILLIGIGNLLNLQMNVPVNTAHQLLKQLILPPKDSVEQIEIIHPKTTKVLARNTEKQISKESFELKSQSELKNSVIQTMTDSIKTEASTPQLASTNIALKETEPQKNALNKSESVDNVLGGRVSGLAVISENKKPDNLPKVPVNIANRTSENVKGKVLDEKGEPVIGATVKIKGKNAGVVTNFNGEFELAAKVDKDKLVASYIGYDKQEIVANGDSNIIRMKDSQLALNEVVVIGYGTVKKSSMTGAVSSTRSSNQIFGESEFKKYFDKNRSKNICTDVKASIRIEFRIDDNGKPVDLKVKKCNCQELENEFNRIVNMSPKWTRKGRTVHLTIVLE